MRISKKTRFEVFQKDKFTCRYCGRTPPDVTLELDHIIPISKGGKNELINYITSCFDCNRGKGAKKLDDKIVRPDIKKINKELRSQIKAMDEYYELSRRVSSRTEYELKNVLNYWYENASNYIGAREECSLRSFLKDFSSDEIKNAIDISTGRVYGWKNKFRYMCGILHNWRKARYGENKVS